MIHLSISGIITLITLLVALLLSFFSLTVKTKNKVPNILIAAYFLATGIEISFFFYEGKVELPLTIHKLRDDMGYLKSPLLYLFFLSTIYTNFRLKRKHLLHLLPFLVVILVFTPRFYAVSEQARILFVQNYLLQPEAIFSAVFAHFQNAFYLLLTFIALGKYKKIIAENYSNHQYFNYRWLYKMTWLLVIIFLFTAGKNLYKYWGDDLLLLNNIRSLLALVLLLFLSWIMINALYHPTLFRGITTDQQPIAQATQKIAKKPTPQLKSDQEMIAKKINTLQQAMTQQALYLDPSLSIDSLAEKVNLPTKEVSILINHYLNKHFYDFVNEHRIKKAIKILEDPTSKSLTMQEVLYDVGFNSKSSFYTLFKKHTQMTPKEYRKKHHASSDNQS